MSKPSWDECRVAKMTAQEAAFTRGVTIATALRQANRGRFAWAKPTPSIDERIEELTAERDRFGERIDELTAKMAVAVDALDCLLDAITASDRIGDRVLTIQGPTSGLKWLAEAEEQAIATLANIGETK